MDSEAVAEVFRAFGPVRCRRMFGGLGVYRDDLMFALVAGGELFLKVDGETLETFQDLGSRPFVYVSRDGRTTTMSYWLIPDSALDDPDEAADLARLAFGAALRARKADTKKRGRSLPRRKAERAA